MGVSSSTAAGDTSAGAGAGAASISASSASTTTAAAATTATAATWGGGGVVVTKAEDDIENNAGNAFALAQLDATELKSLQAVARTSGQSTITRSAFLARLKGIPTELKLRLFWLFANHAPVVRLTSGELLRGVVACCKGDRLTRMVAFVRMFVHGDTTSVSTAEARNMVCLMLAAASPQWAALMDVRLTDDMFLESLRELGWVELELPPSPNDAPVEIGSAVELDDASQRSRAGTLATLSSVHEPPALQLDGVYAAHKEMLDALLWQMNDEHPPGIAHIAAWLAQRVPRIFEQVEQSVHLGFLGAIQSPTKADAPASSSQPAPHIGHHKKHHHGSHGHMSHPGSASSMTPAPAILHAPAEATSASAAAAALIAQQSGASSEKYADPTPARPYDKPMGVDEMLAAAHVPQLDGRLENSLLTESWAWLISSCILDSKYARFEPWKLLYSAASHGFSMTSFERRACDYPGATLLIVRDTKGAVSAAFNPDGWKSSKAFKALDGTILFDLLPKFDANPALVGGERNHVYYNDSANRVAPAGIGFGGKIGAFRLWLGGSLQEGCRQYDDDSSFVPSLLPDAKGKRLFSISQLEVWGLGGRRAEKYQQGHKKWEDKQIERAAAGPRSEWAVDRMILEMAGRQPMPPVD